MRQTTRREFLGKASALVGLSPLLFASEGRGGAGGERLRHACIGVGGQGWSDLNALASHHDIQFVALCDVDVKNLAKAAELFPDARTYRDWRVLLREEAEGIDSVNVTTPDHMHAPITMTALRMGKHVYCQKPLCHDLAECRAVTQEAARRPQQVTQMGIQIHSDTFYRSAIAMIQYGIIGKIREVHSWCGKGWVGPPEVRPDRSDPIPESLNWDLWLGTAPQRPFVKDVYHPGQWRRWQDFGTGTQGDMACHIMDPVFSALELSALFEVQSAGTPPYKETYSPQNRITYRFPGTRFTTGDVLTYHWYDSQAFPDFSQWPLPAHPETGETKPPMQGSMFVGEKGHLLLPHIGGPQPLPREAFVEDIRRFKEEVQLPAIADHYHQFVDAALGRGRTSAPFSYSGPLTECVLTGLVANRFAGQHLNWDAKKGMFSNVAQANAFLRRTYRAGWETEGLS